ncbi:unnamed protein product [Brassica oleracea]
MKIQTRPVLVVVVVVVIMVFMSSFNVEGGERGIHSQNQRLHYFQKGTTVIPSARGVDNHHNIPRQNYDNWGGKGGDGGGDDGTG